MSVSRVHGAYAVELGSTVLGGITAQSLPTGTEVEGEATMSEVFPRGKYIVRQVPVGSFTTKSIAAAFAAVGLLGSDIGGMAGGFKYYAQKMKVGGTRETTLKHRKYTLNHGIIVPQSLSASHGPGGDAAISYGLTVTYDGSNLPIVETDLVTLVSGAADAERFGLGPMTLGGVSLPQVQRCEIDFGAQVQSIGGDGEIYDTAAWIQVIETVITLTGIDVEWMKAANIPLTGKAATHANTTVYFRKRAQAGAYVTDVTAQHVKITADGIITVEGAFDANGNENAECSVICRCRYDGSNDPLVIATASAIT